MRAQPRRADGRGKAGARAASKDQYTDCFRQQVQQASTTALPSRTAIKLKIALDCLVASGADSSTAAEGDSDGEEDEVDEWPAEWMGAEGTGSVPIDPIQAAIFAAYTEEGTRLDAQSASAPSSSRPSSTKAGGRSVSRSTGRAASSSGGVSGGGRKESGAARDPPAAVLRWSHTVQQEKVLVEALREEDQLFYNVLTGMLTVAPRPPQRPVAEEPRATPVSPPSPPPLLPPPGETSPPPLGDRVVAGFRSTSGCPLAPRSGAPPSSGCSRSKRRLRGLAVPSAGLSPVWPMPSKGNALQS
eukprot:GGOE01046288.1.p1 GENE.GGOE01046288.1~~GGOE01046288.1.p1  ORF type:complete len:301 (-),score=40.04 GGOE01046288.1:324-1226(-)